MESLISSIVVLIIAIGIIVMLREQISESDIFIKIGIFSIIVAIVGSILGKFIYIGLLIRSIAIICAIMSFVLKVYCLIFKFIKRMTIKIAMFSLFLFILFSVLGNNNYLISITSNFLEVIMIGKVLSISSMLVCILIEVYNLIFSKKNNNYHNDEIDNSNETII